jgi:hypothetical protein
MPPLDRLMREFPDDEACLEWLLRNCRNEDPGPVLGRSRPSQRATEVALSTEKG